MKHKPRDVRIKGTLYRRCKRCGLACLPANEETVMATKCPGR